LAHIDIHNGPRRVLLGYVDADRNSDKFYEVGVEWAPKENEGHGAWIVTRRWGRIHTHGQASAVSFDHTEAAERHANGLLSAKLRKGYVQARADSGFAAKIPPSVAFDAANGDIFDQPDAFAEQDEDEDEDGIAVMAMKEVRALQRRINALLRAIGEPRIPEDGLHGPATKHALARLRDAGLVLHRPDEGLEDILAALNAIDVEETFSW